MSEETDSKATPPFPGMTKIPYGLPLMMGAWLGCVQWAISEDKMREQFEKDTGHSFSRLIGRAPIVAMVDKATGYDAAVMNAFLDWATVNVWGEEGVGPDPLMELLEELDAKEEPK